MHTLLQHVSLATFVGLIQADNSAVVHLHCCIVVCHMTISQSTRPCFCWWAFRLLAVPHCDKQYCSEGSCTYLLVYKCKNFSGEYT